MESVKNQGSITNCCDGKSPLISAADNSIACYQHLDSDEDSSILKVEPFKYDASKALIFWMLVVISGGVLYLFDFWFLKLHLYLRFSKSDILQASHLLVTTKYFLDLVKIKPKFTKSKGKILTFEHHHLPYYFNGSAIHPIYFESSLKYKTLIDIYGHGYRSILEVEEKKEIFGRCQIVVPVKTVFKLLIEEMLHPFNIFQIWSCALCYCEDYWYYASAIVVITCVSLTSSLIQTKKSMDSMHKLALRECQVIVLREGKKEEVSSTHLVPGDLIEIPKDGEIPCDIVLLSGGCIVDEGMLTGESIPVMKDPLPYLADPIYNIEIDKRHSLYEGTKIIQTRNFGSSHVLGLVVRTGFLTMKGKLVRSILFPKPNKFKFYQDSMKFIAVLIAITFVGFCLCLPFQITLGVPAEELIKRCLDLITVTVPPALPAAMTVGTAFAISRLRKSNIFCISPPRVNVAGKIDTFCFDKTGTLTEDGMNLLGVHPTGEVNRFTDDPKLIASSHKELIEIMASCHSLTMVNNKLIGDTQDLMIFNSTDCVFDEPHEGIYDPAIKALIKPRTTQELADIFSETDNVISLIKPTYELGILHTFHFTSKLKRMGVIVKNIKDDSFWFNMKGAPEIIIENCVPSSLPPNLPEILASYTRSGYRVLGCACKQIPPVKYNELRSLKLEEIEQNLYFKGLIILQNKLKPQTVKAIRDLHSANIRTIMATGDAVLTGICVAKECEILSPNMTVYLGDIIDTTIIWEAFATADAELKNTKPFTMPPWKQYGFDGNYALALTGSAFAHFLKRAESEIQEDKNALRVILERGKVFARMSPENKSQLVEQLQNLKYLVGMCGDGANDCGALKAADIGISLSESDSSIAAPFTSQIADISCVITVLREGRCALTTSLQCFKFMALYSMIQFTTVSMLYYSGSNLSDSQYMTIDLFTVLPLAIFMSYTQSVKKLSKRQPTASLISVPVLTSVIGQSFIAACTQVVTFIVASEMPFWSTIDYKRGTPAKDYLYCWENSVLFLVAWFEYQFICLAFSIGKPWKKSMWTNFWLSATTVILTVCTIFEILHPSDWARHLIDIKPFPFYFRVILLCICCIYGLIAFLFEKFFIPWLDVRNQRRKAIKLLDAKIKDFSNL